MPVGAYKINAWGGNLSDAPVLPNGLQVTSSSSILSGLLFGGDVNIINGNNNICILGYQEEAIRYFAAQASRSFLNTFSLTTGSTTNQGFGLTNTTLDNNVASVSGNVLGPGTSSMLFINVNTTTAGTAQSLNSYGWSLWANNTANSAGAITSNASNVINTDFSSTALTCAYNTNDITQARSITMGYASSTTTNRINTSSYTSTGVRSTVLNFNATVATQDYNIENGVKISTFNTSNTDIRLTWLGFKSDNTLRIGALVIVGSTSPTTPGTFYNPSITYSTKTAMLKSIWDDYTNSITLGVLLHSNQYLRIIKYSSWSNTGATITGSQDFLISDNPNIWYRLCNTGINGLGAIVYFDPYNAPAFKIRFFNINSAGTTLTFGNPIDLAFNSQNNMVAMNADVKWTPNGFFVAIWTTDNTTDGRIFSNLLWPVNKPNYNTNATISYYPSTSSAVNYLSSTQAKFGNSSLRLGFASPGARVNSTNTSAWVDYNIGTAGDFTVECWINPTSFSGTTGTQAYAWRWGLTNYGLQFNVNSSVNRISLLWNNLPYQGPNVSVGTWYHTALVRTSGTIYLYVNGTRYAGPTGDVTDMNANYNVFSVTQTGYSCYVDEFRISNVARYTAASITPPANAFTYDTNTMCLYHFNSNTPSSTYYGNIIDDWGQAYSG